jgi:hypothetical protein
VAPVQWVNSDSEMIASEGHDGAAPEVLGKEEGDGAAAVVAYGRAAGGRAPPA